MKEDQAREYPKLSKRDVSPDLYAATVGILGMTGWTASLALTESLHPKPGNTCVISAAAGAVGSVAGQIAKLMGASKYAT